MIPIKFWSARELLLEGATAGRRGQSGTLHSPAKRRYTYVMTTAIEGTAGPRVSPSALRVRRHRERRREGVRLVTVEVPEAIINHTIARALLKPEDGAKPWLLMRACYASLLSDAALDWLVRNKVIRGEQRTDAAAILRSISDWLGRAG